jgi:hypothetical protein
MALAIARSERLTTNNWYWRLLSVLTAEFDIDTFIGVALPGRFDASLASWLFVD